MNKMSVEEKVQQVVVAKCFNYQNQFNKEYKNSSIQKDRCLIRKQIEKKELSWEYVKILLYFINAIDLDKLEKNKSLELQIKSLKEKQESREVVLKVEKINMRDTIKKQYENEFKEKYCVGRIKELEEENNNLRAKLQDFWFKEKQISIKEEQSVKEQIQSLTQQVAELTLKNSELNKIKTPSKCKKCKIHKKRILSLQTKLLDYEDSDDEDSASSCQSD